ncbi:Clp protease N-terminal domain-containing protein [Streptomyces sp. NPDC050856]|uniref:Clp protease N-terminal domain-containing protein n=1 Tax=Streptomyces sp. NPDC050856 TaxID=3154939 RepID=UPI003400F6F1
MPATRAGRGRASPRRWTSAGSRCTRSTRADAEPKARRSRVFELFTDRARHAVVLSQDEAIALGHDFIGTEHLLLGLVGTDRSTAGDVLRPVVHRHRRRGDPAPGQ